MKLVITLWGKLLKKLNYFRPTTFKHFWLQPIERKTNNGAIQSIVLKPKFPIRRLVFPVFNMLWFSVHYVMHLLNKPTNKLCFNLKNNTVCYYWLIIFWKNPSSSYSLHTHTHTHLHALHREYVSQKYTVGTEQCLSEPGCFHSSDDQEDSVWAHGFPVPQV